MRIRTLTAVAVVALAAACAQQEEEMVYVDVPYDKYGGVAGGQIVDGYYVLDDGTVVGPVSPDVVDGNRNRNREQNQAQVTTETQTTQRTRTGN